MISLLWKSSILWARNLPQFTLLSTNLVSAPSSSTQQPNQFISATLTYFSTHPAHLLSRNRFPSLFTNKPNSCRYLPRSTNHLNFSLTNFQLKANFSFTSMLKHRLEALSNRLTFLWPPILETVYCTVLDRISIL